jgi:hypothetical protein
MTLITILNIIGCIGITAAVVTPLAWAIRSERRHEAPATPARLMVKPDPRPRPSRHARGAHADRRPAYEPN